MDEMMNKLLKLEEWYGIEKLLEAYKGKFIWQPDKDSNQLDMLEDKLIESFSWDEISISASRDGFAVDYVRLDEVFDGGKVILRGNGESKNEARLNAIINYVEHGLIK